MLCKRKIQNNTHIFKWLVQLQQLKDGVLANVIDPLWHQFFVIVFVLEVCVDRLYREGDIRSAKLK